MSKIEVNTIDTQCGANLTVGAACKSVTIAGNDIRSNNYKASDGGIIISQSGTNITLGASGDTISLASGATQTGFGRTGTVDWDTTAKTASFTAVSGNGYFVNTTSGAITMTLPATPSAGDIVSVKDYAGTFATNNLTIDRNGSNLDGAAADSIRSTNNESLTLVYVDGTQGWKSVEEGTGYIGETFIQATGGTITTCGNDKIHTFTGPGTFTVCSASTSSANNIVSYMVVAGGGGGGNWFYGGAGGAGGFREVKSPSTSYTASPLDGYACAPNRITVTATAYPITVGGGGASPGTPSSPGQTGVQGSNSVFSTITSAGGGGGGATPCATPSPTGVGGNGGSGGGGVGGPDAAPCKAGGSGNTPPVSPPQGNPGGAGNPGAQAAAGGLGGSGGGATAAGTQPTTNGTAPAAAGGAGATTSISGTPTTYAGGGGGGANACASIAGGPGGAGGGGNGAGRGNSSPIPIEASAGTTNTGGGGGGASHPCQGGCFSGKAGGSGIVIIRYKYQ